MLRASHLEAVWGRLAVLSSGIVSTYTTPVLLEASLARQWGRRATLDLQVGASSGRLPLGSRQRSRKSTPHAIAQCCNSPLSSIGGACRLIDQSICHTWAL